MVVIFFTQNYGIPFLTKNGSSFIIFIVYIKFYNFSF